MRRLAPLLALAACTFDLDREPPESIRVQDCLAVADCREPQVVAHSANFLFAPGNSPAAYDASLAQAVRVLETDIRVTADGVPVLLHDDELDFPFGDCEGLVSTSTWEEIAGCTFKVDRTGLVLYDPEALPAQHPLTLEGLVERADGRALVVAEIKKDPANDALRVVQARGWLDRVLFLASHEEYASLRAASADAWVILRTRSAADVDAAIAADDPRVVAFHGDEDWTTDEVLARAHAARRKVWINTFSNPGAALREMDGEELCTGFWDQGFDLVQTNRPDLCVLAAASR